MKIYKIKVNGKTYKVELEAIDNIADQPKVETKKEENKIETKPTTNTQGNNVISPIQGVVVNVKVKVGDKVRKGDVVCVVEAMKLENDVVSNFDGEVSEIFVTKGQNVAAKAPLISVK